MTTVINSPRSDSEGIAGVVIGFIVVLLLVVLFVVYGLPMMRGSAPAENSGVNIDVQLPATESSGGVGDGGADAE